MTAKEELKEFLENCTDADLAKLNYPITGIECAKMIIAAGLGGVRTEVHRHRDGRVTIKKIMIQKESPAGRGGAITGCGVGLSLSAAVDEEEL